MRYSRCRAIRSGMTLVEVVAGMTLLACLATGILLAYGAHQKQLRRAEQKIAAVQVADKLLTEWYSGHTTVPRNRQGRVLMGQENWIWSTQSVDVTAIGSISFERIRVEIYPEDYRRDRSPSAVVELLTPVDHPMSGGRI